MRLYHLLLWSIQELLIVCQWLMTLFRHQLQDITEIFLLWNDHVFSVWVFIFWSHWSHGVALLLAFALALSGLLIVTLMDFIADHLLCVYMAGRRLLINFDSFPDEYWLRILLP